MTFVKGALSGLAAIILAELVAIYWIVFRGINNSKATGTAALAGGFLESLISPLFWLLAIAFFTIFLKASRATSGTLRTVLFWIPTVGVTCLGVTIVSLFSYLYFHYRNG